MPAGFTTGRNFDGACLFFPTAFMTGLGRLHHRLTRKGHHRDDKYSENNQRHQNLEKMMFIDRSHHLHPS
jgi:hypothetical protein